MPNFKRGVDSKQGFTLDGSAKNYTTDTLPDPAMLIPGTTVVVTTPYGENVATVVNGAFRYTMPFVTTWSSRPPASSVPVGTELQVTDYANQKWVSDGTYWRPAQGRVLIYSKWGSLSSPISIIQNSTGAAFTIAGGAPKIPAGMIVPNSKVFAQADSRKIGGNAKASAFIRLGTAGNMSDSAIVGIYIPVAANSDAVLTAAARFGSQKTSFTTRDFIGDGFTSTSNVGAAYDRTSQINTDTDMFFTFGVSVASASDVFNLIGCHISLEA